MPQYAEPKRKVPTKPTDVAETAIATTTDSIQTTVNHRRNNNDGNRICLHRVVVTMDITACRGRRRMVITVAIFFRRARMIRTDRLRHITEEEMATIDTTTAISMMILAEEVHHHRRRRQSMIAFIVDAAETPMMTIEVVLMVLDFVADPETWIIPTIAYTVAEETAVEDGPVILRRLTI
jgi:hypothetical protein